MFLADWAFNNALRRTSVASATVIVSSQNVVVFLLAVLTKIEKFCWIKLGGVLISMIGIALTAVHDTSDENTEELVDYANAIYGDLFAVAAAIAYGLYTVQVRLFCPQNEELYKMQVRLIDAYFFDTLYSCPHTHYFFMSCQSSVIDGIHRASSVGTMSSICSIYDIQRSRQLHLVHFGLYCSQGFIRFCADGLFLIPIRSVDFRYNCDSRFRVDDPHGVCCRPHFQSRLCDIIILSDWSGVGGCRFY